jgi:serine-type D-Ala-D-Ala carboxypeptidase (penicillin-binding protein 5/6)
MITLALKFLDSKNWIFLLMNKIFIISIIVFFKSTLLVFASPNIQARTAILIDYHSNEVLFELEADEQIYPASMTKIMTAIVAIDLIKKNKLSLDDEFTISENAWRLSQAGYSSMFIMINDQVSVEDLLKGIIIASGNDACVALAEGIAGSELNFAEMMNEKASEIGMTSTNFTNASGINDPDNVSTVRDIALMSQYLIANFPEFYELFKEKTFTWDRTGGDPIKQGNRNPLLYKNVGVDGVKTGYLAVEKYSLASSMKKNNRRVIAVASGFETKNSRSKESLKLLNWGFRNTNTFEISTKNKSNFEIDTWLGNKNKINATSKENFFVTIRKKDIRHLNVSLNYNGPVKAPIQEGEQIAELVISKKDNILKTIPLYASENLKKVNFFKSLITSLNYLIWGDV